MNKTTFDSLSLSPELLKAVTDMGFQTPSPIQAQAIPHLLEGKDLIGQARTGTGKTAAFALPILEKIDASDYNVQAIVLCPTRELAVQVSEQMISLAKYKRNVSVLPIFGGQLIDRQFAGLRKGAQIIVGTPGRVLDHLNRKTLKLDHVKIAVLDEADEMLDMGFRDDIETILSSTSTNRQTVLFSATMSSDILRLAQRFQNNPEMVKVADEKVQTASIEECFYAVDGSSKMALLSLLIELHEPTLAIIFCNTKRKVDEVIDRLQAKGYPVDGLHGDMNQPKRTRVMSKFKNQEIKFLVATDVAARGIDVSGIDMVFNFDLPADKESYVHRIGRTGRAGRTGKAFSLVSHREMYDLRDIQRYTSNPIKELPIPSHEDVQQGKALKLVNNIKSAMLDSSIEEYRSLLRQLNQQDLSNDDIAAALLKMMVHTEVEKIVPAGARSGGDYGNNRSGSGRRYHRSDRSSSGSGYRSERSSSPRDSFNRRRSPRRFDEGGQSDWRGVQK
jgi:ATP-dependent RNA helicase DeaD